MGMELGREGKGREASAKEGKRIAKWKWTGDYREKAPAAACDQQKRPKELHPRRSPCAGNSKEHEHDTTPRDQSAWFLNCAGSYTPGSRRR